MALTIHSEVRLVRLIDSVNDNPLELTLGLASDGRISVQLEDRDSGQATRQLHLDIDELVAGLALLEMKRPPYIEE